MVEALEQKFRDITLLLYDTRVPSEALEREVYPYLSEDIRFTDPWQQASGKAKYQRGASGFHCMFKFDFDILQLNVQLEKSGTKGRAMVDGVMNLRALEQLYVYPLRTILTYGFTRHGKSDFLIHEHVEMWSFGDMLEAIPGSGWVYKKLFRPAFSQGFLAASALCGKMKR